MAFITLIGMNFWFLQSLDQSIRLDGMSQRFPGSKINPPAEDGERTLISNPKEGSQGRVRWTSTQYESHPVRNNKNLTSDQIPNTQWFEKIKWQQLLLEVKKGPQFRHPDFVRDVNDACSRLQSNNNKKREEIDSKNVTHTVSSWELAIPPIDQDVVFEEFFLPPPRFDPNITLVVLVLSAHENFFQREAIRKTWGVTNMTFFIVGHSRDDGTTSSDRQRMLQEQTIYGDLVEIPMIESYAKLPEKVIQAYRWTMIHLPNIRWIAKVDDDSFVRPKNLDRYLDNYSPNVPTLIGKIIPHSRTPRNGKWAEHEWKPEFFPYWAIGSAGHIVSRRVANYVIDNSTSLHRYQGEDTSLGIWLHQWEEKVTYIQASSIMTNEGITLCGNPQYVMIGHDLSLEEIYHCYLQFQNVTSSTENKLVDISVAHPDLTKVILESKD